MSCHLIEFIQSHHEIVAHPVAVERWRLGSVPSGTFHSEDGKVVDPGDIPASIVIVRHSDRNREPPPDRPAEYVTLRHLPGTGHTDADNVGIVNT